MTDVSNSSSADPPVTRHRLGKQPDQPKTPEKLHGLDMALYDHCRGTLQAYIGSGS